MNITTKDFEMAVEIGFKHGVKGALGHLLTPDEWKSRVQKAVLEAFSNHSLASQDVPADDGQRNPAAEEGVTNHD